MRKHFRSIFIVAFAAAGLFALSPSGDERLAHAAGKGGVGGGGKGGGGGFCDPSRDVNPTPPAVQGYVEAVTFDPGAIIIPMDVCYQRPTRLTLDVDQQATMFEAYDTYDVAATIGNKFCNASSNKDDGMIAAYGMIMRLINDGIPVHWAIRAGGTAGTNKQSWGDHDFSIAGGGAGPVKHMTHDGTVTAPYATLSEIVYAGAPFIISADDAADALDKIKSYELIRCSDPLDPTTCVDKYDEMDFHVAQTSFDAPIYKTIGELPSIAVFDCNGTDGGLHQCGSNLTKLQSSIEDIGMDDFEGVFWEYVDMDDIVAGNLISEDYDLLWLPAFSVKPTTTLSADELSFYTQMEAYMANGGNMTVQDQAIHNIEGYGTWDGVSYTEEFAPTLVSEKMRHSTNGVIYGWTSASYTDLTDSEDYSDPAAQWGGADWQGIGGSKYDWSPRCGGGLYQSGTRRMVFSSALVGDELEFAAWRYYDGKSDNGRTFYLGGYNWRRVTHTGFRLLMNTILVTSSDYTALSGALEASRADTIIATVDANELQVLGTFEINEDGGGAPNYANSGDAGTYYFPYVKGHVRALDVNTLTDPDALTDYREMDDPPDPSLPNPLVFDAEDQVATMTANTAGTGCTWPATDDGCRRIFTYYWGSSADGETKRVPFAESYIWWIAYAGLAYDTNYNYLPDIYNDTKFLMDRVVAGNPDGSGGYTPAMGGVDRSTVAVIGNSPVTGNDRPTMIYVGAADGMLHAICAEIKGPCGKQGQELWAYMPQSELSRVMSNTNRFDGSPRVADVYADFDYDGEREYRTVLSFSTGNSYPSSVGTLDITDPANPDILWEDKDMQQGSDIAMGQVVAYGQGLTTMMYSQTMNWAQYYMDQGWYTDYPSGFQVYARDAAQEWYWYWSHYWEYPIPRDEENNRYVPRTAVPGGVTLYSSTGGILTDQIIVPSIYGQVFRFDAGNGDSDIGWRSETVRWNGSYYNWWQPSPIFEIKRDYHPIGSGVSVYRDRNTRDLHGVAVTGGYTDTQNPSAALWSPDNVEQFALSFPLDTETTIGWDPGPPPGDGCVSDCVWKESEWGIKIDFGAGQRAFSPALVAGNEIFVTTDSSNVNSEDFGTGTGNTGRLWRSNLEAGSTAFNVTLQTGAGGIDISSSGAVIASAGASQTKATQTEAMGGGALDTDGGGAVGGYVTETADRFLWLRTR